MNPLIAGLFAINSIKFRDDSILRNLILGRRQNHIKFQAFMINDHENTKKRWFF
jgi:hypothetical protein